MGYSIYAMKVSNKSAGHYWFEPDTLRFFSSRISQEVFSAGKDRGQYFVSSERYNYKSPRLYTVRRFEPATGEIGTAPGHSFQEYATLATAKRHARKAAQQERDERDYLDWTDA